MIVLLRVCGVGREGERERPGLVLSHITQKVPKQNECYTEVEGYE